MEQGSAATARPVADFRSVLFVPGWGGSPPTHWQAHWRRRMPGARWLEQADWWRPTLKAWLLTLSAELEAHPGTVVVAHSLGCTLVAHLAAQRTPLQVTGVLFVAPPDLEVDQRTPAALRPFGPSPRIRLPCPALLAASRSDPYATFAHSEDLAERWGAELVDLGPRGHVNVDSGVGGWPEGLALLRRLAIPRERSNAQLRSAAGPGSISTDRPQIMPGPSSF